MERMVFIHYSSFSRGLLSLHPPLQHGSSKALKIISNEKEILWHILFIERRQPLSLQRTFNESNSQIWNPSDMPRKPTVILSPWKVFPRTL